jgi:hypothetical protein
MSSKENENRRNEYYMILSEFRKKKYWNWSLDGRNMRQYRLVFKNESAQDMGLVCT